MSTVETFDETTYTSDQVCALVGVSYRMLDYWLRKGYVVIDQPEPGSGHARQFTPEDVAALHEVVAEYQAANTIIANFTSGELWKQSQQKGSNDARRRHPSSRRHPAGGRRARG